MDIVDEILEKAKLGKDWIHYMNRFNPVNFIFESRELNIEIMFPRWEFQPQVLGWVFSEVRIYKGSVESYRTEISQRSSGMLNLSIFQRFRLYRGLRKLAKENYARERQKEIKDGLSTVERIKEK